MKAILGLVFLLVMSPALAAETYEPNVGMFDALLIALEAYPGTAVEIMPDGVRTSTGVHATWLVIIDEGGAITGHHVHVSQKTGQILKAERLPLASMQAHRVQ